MNEVRKIRKVIDRENENDGDNINQHFISIMKKQKLLQNKQHTSYTMRKYKT